jgi:hypothetical protein
LIVINATAMIIADRKNCLMDNCMGLLRKF